MPGKIGPTRHFFHGGAENLTRVRQQLTGRRGHRPRIRLYRRLSPPLDVNRQVAAGLIRQNIRVIGILPDSEGDRVRRPRRGCHGLPPPIDKSARSRWWTPTRHHPDQPGPPTTRRQRSTPPTADPETQRAYPHRPMAHHNPQAADQQARPDPTHTPAEPPQDDRTHSRRTPGAGGTNAHPHPYPRTCRPSRHCGSGHQSAHVRRPRLTGGAASCWPNGRGIPLEPYAKGQTCRPLRFAAWAARIA